MPSLGTFTPACWLDALPAVPRDAWVHLLDQGWADQSTLFFPSRYPEVPLRMLLTGASVTDLDAKLKTLRSLRKTKVKADDGMRSIDKCLVLGVAAGPPEFCAMILGGSAAADTWEQEVIVFIQPPSPELA